MKISFKPPKIHYFAFVIYLKKKNCELVILITLLVLVLK